MEKKEEQFIYATGRRKSALARVYIQRGKGAFSVNKKELDSYFVLANLRQVALSPLELINSKDFTVKTYVKGGGISGQAGAIKLGLARALSQLDPELRFSFRKEGYLTRDSRRVERKKYGQKGARKKFQYSKR